MVNWCGEWVKQRPIAGVLNIRTKLARQRVQSGRRDDCVMCKKHINGNLAIKVTAISNLSTGGRTQHSQASKLFMLELSVKNAWCWGSLKGQVYRYRYSVAPSLPKMSCQKGEKWTESEEFS